MIGLGSNRLSVCRRGGMRVTQAGKGGMEWLAGGRMPSWTSPYSAQATAALKAQFPTQWPTIKAYGFAHPEIVGYMNAYAPEDAKIAYSLVPTLGRRWVENSAEGAYFDVGVPITAKSEIEVSLVRTGTANGMQIMGTQTTNTTGLDLFIFEGDNLRFYTGGSSLSGYTLGVIQRNEIADLIIRNGYAKCNNTESAPEIKYENGYRNFIFVISDKNTPRSTSNKFIGKWGKYIHKEDGVKVREMYPFIRKINGVDVCGMIDVLSGTFYQNAGSGSFTISETPSS